jgi:hypothetical protein
MQLLKHETDGKSESRSAVVEQDRCSGGGLLHPKPPCLELVEVTTSSRIVQLWISEAVKANKSKWPS